jgi:hypothetical protein
LEFQCGRVGGGKPRWRRSGVAAEGWRAGVVLDPGASVARVPEEARRTFLRDRLGHWDAGWRLAGDNGILSFKYGCTPLWRAAL